MVDGFIGVRPGGQPLELCDVLITNGKRQSKVYTDVLRPGIAFDKAAFDELKGNFP